MENKKYMHLIDTDASARQNGFADAEHQKRVIKLIEETVASLYGKIGDKEGVHTQAYLFTISVILGAALGVIELNAPHAYDTFIRALLDTIDQTRVTARIVAETTKAKDIAEQIPDKGDLN